MAKSIEIDRKKRLREEPGKGHNRWHPDIAHLEKLERTVSALLPEDIFEN